MSSGADRVQRVRPDTLRPRSLLRVLGVSATTGLLVAALWLGGALARLEGMAFDALATRVRGERSAPAEVAIILVDEASLRAMDPLVGRWPWPRSVFADVLDFLAVGGARAVVVDVLFLEQERAQGAAGGGPAEGDRRLIDATRSSGMVTHAARLLWEETDDGGRTLLDRPLPRAFALSQRLELADSVHAPRPAVPCNNYYLPLDGLYQAAARVGAVDFGPDADGVFRRAPLLREYQGRWYPALGLAPLLDDPRFSTLQWQPDGLRLGSLDVPLDEQGNFLLNPYGSYDTYSMSGVLASIQRLWEGEVEDLLVSPYEFEDRVVFIGASATGLEDLKRTAVLHSSPGVFLHAGITANLLIGDVLRRVPAVAAVALNAVFAVVTVTLILGARRLLVQVGAPILLAAGYAGGSVYGFTQNTLLPVAPPLVTILTAWVVAFAVRAATEGRHQRRVRRMLSQYVSPAVLEEVVDRYEEVLQAEVGQARTLSVLFSDIRGFTDLAETLDAREVVEVLNIYFSHMTDAVFEHGGTVDKFIGDAMMCFWGAPILSADHAEDAVRCALAMAARLNEVNRILATRGRSPIVIGIGVNTGEMVLGNIGSERKLDYTVIGDQVNLASRLEGLTKRYGCGILLADETRRRLGVDLPCGVVDQVRVKGKTRPLRVYRPLVPFRAGADAVERGRRLQDAYERAFRAYLERDWKRALGLYGDLPDDGVRTELLQRCRALLAAGAPPEWDGVHTLTVK